METPRFIWNAGIIMALIALGKQRKCCVVTLLRFPRCTSPATGGRAQPGCGIATDDLKKKFGGIEGLPTTLLYDRQGILRQKIIGFEYTDVIEADLKQLL